MEVKEEKRFYRTLVKGTDKRSNIDYNIGKIEGIMYALCGKMNEKPPHNKRIPYGIELRIETKPSRYELFAKAVEFMYPDLCVFDWQK